MDALMLRVTPPLASSPLKRVRREHTFAKGGIARDESEVDRIKHSLEDGLNLARFGGVSRRTQMRRLSAFTLVELLVVLVIVAVLASILLPAISGTKFQAKNLRCKNNLRQIGLALEMYVNDYHRFPPVFSYLDHGARFYYQWDQLLQTYLSAGTVITPFDQEKGSRPVVNKLLMCPFFVPTQANMPFNTFFINVPRYNYNTTGVAEERYDQGRDWGPLGLASMFFDWSFDWEIPRQITIGESKVRVPSDMIALGDPFVRSEAPDLDGLVQEGDGLWHPIRSLWYLKQVPSLVAQSRSALKIHGAKSNKAFCDGHIETETLSRPFVATEQNLMRWNNDNQSHRDRWESN